MWFSKPTSPSRRQRQVDYVFGVMAEEKSRRLGMDRRAFLASSMGLATYFLAANQVHGKYWEVEEAEAVDPGAYEDKYPKGEYFIFDVQAHFSTVAAQVDNQGTVLKQEPPRAVTDFLFPSFVEKMFFESETAMVVIAGLPGREQQHDAKGNVLADARRGGGVLPSWRMARARNDLNELAGSVRALCQGNCAPNHYWDKTANRQDQVALFEQMEREVKQYKIDSWMWSCHTDPGVSGNGFWLDDEKLTYPFYEKSKELGLRLFGVQKGYSSRSRTLGHLAHPKDVEKAALDHPELTFVIYNSALQCGPDEPNFRQPNFYDSATGDFPWHDALVKIKQRNPQVANIYLEFGKSFASLAAGHPEMCQHLVGKNVKYFGADHVLWGTKALLSGTPQGPIEAMKRFQISDELCDKFGYKKLTKEDKAAIFGLNAARLYKIDATEQRKTISKDNLEKLKQS